MKWNTAVPRVPLSYNIVTQAQYNDVICSNNEWSRIISPFQDFQNIQWATYGASTSTTTELAEFIGVGLNGVLLSNGLKSTDINVDPLYPIKYGHVDDPNEGYKKFDECMTTIEDDNGYGIHHYHIVSPCIID